MLLLISRPAGARHWIWLTAAVLLTGLWGSSAAGPAAGVIAGAALMGAGAFALSELGRPAPPFGRAVRSTMIGLVTAVLVAGSQGRPWTTVQAAYGDEIRATFEAQARTLERRAFDPAIVEQLRQLGAGGETLGRFLPALLFLSALAGMMLAWRWHERVARTPLTPTASPLRRFRFGDHALWLLVLGLGLVLLNVPRYPLGMSLRLWGANLLAVMVVLYAVRGLAVFLSAAQRAPRHVTVVLTAIGILIWPFAVSGLTLLGLADSWIDFRRRFEAPHPEEVSHD